MSDSQNITWEGHEVWVVMDHQMAEYLVRSNGFEPSKLRPGSDAIFQGFRDRAGRAVLYIDHRIRGPHCLVLQTLPAPRRADMILDRMWESLIGP